MSLRISLRFPLALSPVAAALAAILTVDGCTSMACIEWSPDKGACPSRDEALLRFGGTSCVSEILSVDSDGIADDTACCYDVTKRRASDTSCALNDNIPGTPNGPPGMDTPCGGCAAFRDGPAVELCKGVSVDIFNALTTCMCSGACQEACNDGSCSNAADNPGCQACVTDVNTGCGAESKACDNDI